MRCREHGFRRLLAVDWSLILEPVTSGGYRGRCPQRTIGQERPLSLARSKAASLWNRTWKRTLRVGAPRQRRQLMSEAIASELPQRSCQAPNTLFDLISLQQRVTHDQTSRTN